jgi:DNA adenine methylase
VTDQTSRAPSGIQPFLRWAGGKRWLARRLAPIVKGVLRRAGGTYWEPFLGGGAVFFALAPQKAVLSDINDELLNAYRWVRDDPDGLIAQIKEWPVSIETYAMVRSQREFAGIERAARFLYLNRTCYGGLYRTNRKGMFNTPFGGGSRTPEPLWRDHLLARASFCLRSNVLLEQRDFARSLYEAKAGDVVYCDPTYSAVRRGQFDRYGSTIFAWADQERLAELAHCAFHRGVTVLVSNGVFPDLHEPYRAAYRLRLRKLKSIGNAARNAAVHEEYLLVLDPESRRRLWERLAPIENRRVSKSARVFTNKASEDRVRLVS